LFLANGTISFTPNDSFVGDNFVNITVTDQPGLINSTIINFSVVNVEDDPVLGLIGNWTVNEDEEFYNDTSADDEDLLIPGTTEYLRFSDNTSLFDIDAVTGEISWTPNSSQIGEHTINISVNDSTGRIDYEIIKITVSEVNDKPIIIGDQHLIANENVEFYYDFNATDEEDDPSGSENGSINYADNTTLFNIDIFNGTIVWTPNSTQAGTYWINITVNDTQNVYDSLLVNITVYANNSAPVINDEVSTPTGNEGGVEENDSITFTVFVDDVDENDLMYNWTVDGVQNQTSSDSGAGTQSDSFNYGANFTDEGEHNITVVVSDGILTDAHYWNVTVNHTNAPPTFTGEIENQSVSATGATSVSIELSDYFADSDYSDSAYNQSVSFNWSQMNETRSLLASPTFTVSVNNVTWVATISSSNTGLEIIEFVMNDSDYSAYSNNFSVNISISAEEAAPVSGGGGGGGGGGGARKYVAIDIIHPGDVSLIVGEKIITPIIIRNTGDLTLNNIGLEATTSSVDIDLSLSKTSIPFLAKGQEETVELTIITSNETQEGKKEIIVRAPVGSPAVTDSVKFFVSLIEFGLEDKTLVKEKIVYLKDLVNENPECLELQEVIIKAENLMNAEEFQKATELTRQAIQACKDLVASVSSKKVEFPLIRIAGDNIYLIIAEFIALLVIIWLIYRYLKRRKRKKMLK